MSEAPVSDQELGGISREEIMSALFAQLVMQQSNMAMLLLGALITALAGEAPDSPGVLVSLLGLPAYLAIMVWGVQPLLRWSATALLRDGRMSERALAAVCAVALGQQDRVLAPRAADTP